MHLRTWFSTYNAQKLELKLAGILAITTACIVLLIVSWSFLSSTTQNSISDAQTSTNQRVQTIDRPALPQTPDISKQQNSPKKQAPTLQQKTPSHQKKATKSETNINKIVLGQGNYFVQVGAFSQAKLARLMLEKMKTKYHYAIIKRKGDKHAVWVGPVIGKTAAASLQKYLQRKSNIQGFIVTEK